MATRWVRWLLSLVLVGLVIGCAASNANPDAQQACELDPDAVGDVGSTAEALSSVSCNVKNETGYKSGTPFKIQVVEVDGKPVEWETANAYMKMAEAAAKAGVQLHVVSGFRTMAEQKDLYACYVHCNCNGCAEAAVPGTSNHQSGHALDLNTSAGGVYNWMSKHAASFGFKRTVPGELWHWEWWGHDDGTGPCNGATLQASLTHEWSSLPKADGKTADFRACTGQSFDLGLTFENKGSAAWRDVKGRGSSMGSDVFLTTLSGKADPLTGAKHYSVSRNTNAHVRGDHDAKDCVDADGCKKTLFIAGGMHAKAPKKVGIYVSSWRLRDYSKIWGKSKSFGPKVKVRIKVDKCSASQLTCGCHVWCDDGTDKNIAAGAVTDAASCKTLGETVCLPANLSSASFNACDGSSGAVDAGGSESSPDESDPVPAGWSSWDSGDPIISSNETTSEPDDPGFDDSGFDGNDQKPLGGTTPANDGGCSLSPRGASGSGALGFLVACFLFGGALLRRRRVTNVAAGAGIALVLSGCGPSDGEELVGRAQQEVGTPKKAFCKVNVSGKGQKDLENDYLPHVITCEDNGAKLEAMKAQAIAARSVAYYEMATDGSICDGQGCQVYSCGTAATELARRAVRETSGMYLSHGGSITYGFFVAGDSGANPPSCKDNGGATSNYVTYNAGKTGNAVNETSLGGNGSQNRGCMSQWGARCLDDHKNYDFMHILRFYYGADINVIQADGPCVDSRTLEAKLVRKWSNAKRARGKKADYEVCAGDEFDIGFTFKNTGSTTWRDVDGRGDHAGDDVFLVTASGKTDQLTGEKRFSLQLNENSEVRGDHDSKDCVAQGCRKTTFIQGGMHAKAPKKPGIYRSRWRLRDYSKESKGSKGFGPKVEIDVAVQACKPRADKCGCTISCSDGKHETLVADIADDAFCKTVAETVCLPAQLVSHDFVACAADPGAGGSGGADPGASDSGASDPGASDPGGGGQAGASSDPANQDDPVNDWNTDSPDDMLPTDEQDDPGFQDDGFDGDARGKYKPGAEQSSGCSISPARSGTSAVVFAALFGICVRRRRRVRG